MDLKRKFKETKPSSRVAYPATKKLNNKNLYHSYLLLWELGRLLGFDTPGDIWPDGKVCPPTQLIWKAPDELIRMKPGCLGCPSSIIWAAGWPGDWCTWNCGLAGVIGRKWGLGDWGINIPLLDRDLSCDKGEDPGGTIPSWTDGLRWIGLGGAFIEESFSVLAT